MNINDKVIVNELEKATHQYPATPTGSVGRIINTDGFYAEVDFGELGIHTIDTRFLDLHKGGEK